MIPGSNRNHPTFAKSFLFALQGLRYALKTERNIRVMLGAGVFAVVMGIVLGIDATSWAVVALCCGAVIMAELMNTAVETVVDLVSPEFHPLAGHAKDIAAAGVWVLSAAAAVAGLVIFGSAIAEKFF